MVLTSLEDGRVHFRNTGMKVLRAMAAVKRIPVHYHSVVYTCTFYHLTRLSPYLIF